MIVEETECMLTTIDNPFDPFTQFDQWNQFDIEHKYYSCARLARLLNLSEDMSTKEVDEAREKAIDRLIELDPLDLYKKATRKVAVKQHTEG